MSSLPERMLSTPALALAVVVFVAFLLLLEGSYLLWRSAFGAQARRRSQRLQALAWERDQSRVAARKPAAASGPSGLSGPLAPWGPLDIWLDRLPVLSWTERILRQAGIQWLPAQLLALSVLAALLAALVVQLLRDTVALSLAMGLVVGLSPWVYVALRRRRRLQTLQKQLPDVLDMLARALRAGHALSAALLMAGQEMAEPMASELRLVHEEVKFGLTLPQALDHLVERVPLADLRYFVVAVLIQRESGGNLAEVMGKLAQLIRARSRLLDRVRVLSSEGRLSAWILGLMPFLLGALLAVFNPRFMQPLWTDPLGIVMLKWMLGMMALGVFLIARVVRIRV